MTCPPLVLLALLTGCPSTSQPSKETGDTQAAPCTWYPDRDVDGWGDGDGSMEAPCQDPPPGTVDRGGDCDDANAASYPGSTEFCDSLDNDCDGTVDEDLGATWWRDADGDGFGNPEVTSSSCDPGSGWVEDGTDCDDGDPAVHPLAQEVCDGLDQDCDDLPDQGLTSTWYPDRDQDGWGDDGAATEGCDPGAGYVAQGGDCNDWNAAISPEGQEVCDGQDNDCDGLMDDFDPDRVGAAAWYLDADGDGWGSDSDSISTCETPSGYVDRGGDCDTSDPAIHPGADETDCADPVDYNCDGSVAWADADADGFAACVECDDSRAGIHPGATETCNDLDDDCDGTTDEPDAVGASTWYADADGDGWGDASTSTVACAAPPGFVADATGGAAFDCDDTQAVAWPGAPEICDWVDNDCDGTVDEGVLSSFWMDGDGDGFGDPALLVEACEALPGTVADATDCDDSDALVHPGADEVCNATDDDCDDAVDEGVLSSFWFDNDGDGWGDPSLGVESCDRLPGTVTDATDCDDSDPAVYPEAPETCNGLDDDCDRTVDEASALDAPTWYADADADGFGDGAAPTVACTAPAGHVTNALDCDDDDPTLRPGATEVCDGVDQDCDGTADDGVRLTFYRDADADGYGTSATSTLDCSLPSGYASNALDCDDTRSTVSPAATESCNSLDDDCDGTTDEGVKLTFYRDTDGDGYGTSATSTSACSAPAGYVSTWTDCNDDAVTVYPGAAETCNSVDDDCDGTTDEGVTTLYYRDADSDGYGVSTSTTYACSTPAGYSTLPTDCNDASSTVRPGATETCNSVDDDCDGSVDEGVKTTWYLDADGDGYGVSTSTTTGCSKPAGYSTVSTDCSDASASIYPGAYEHCNAADDNCDGYADNGGTCPCTVLYYYDVRPYLFCPYAYTWASAQWACYYYGYDMVTVSDATEDNWVNYYADVYGSGSYWWIGMNDVAAEGWWGWEDGSATTYTNWCSGEPNNCCGGEDCGHLNLYSTSYCWNDAGCSGTAYFVCEAD